jgi:hypothetical protein
MAYIFILYLYSIIILNRFFYKLAQTLNRLTWVRKKVIRLSHGTEVENSRCGVSILENHEPVALG